jgi:hypothetical protein
MNRSAVNLVNLYEAAVWSSDGAQRTPEILGDIVLRVAMNARRQFGWVAKVKG